MRRRASRNAPLSIPASDWNRLLTLIESRGIGAEGGINAVVVAPGTWPQETPDFIQAAPYEEMFGIGRAVNIYRANKRDRANKRENSWFACAWHVSLKAFLDYGIYEYESNPFWLGYAWRFMHSIGVITGGVYPHFSVATSGMQWFLMVDPANVSVAPVGILGPPGGYLMPRPDGLWQRCSFGPVELISIDYGTETQVVTNISDENIIVRRNAYLALGKFAQNSVQQAFLEPSTTPGVFYVVETREGTWGGAYAIRHPAVIGAGYLNFVNRLSSAVLPAGCRFVYERLSDWGFSPTDNDPRQNTQITLVDIDC